MGFSHSLARAWHSLGHLDVVPVEAGTESKWKHPPFSGVVADNFVWSRGALDDKASVVAILEAVEWLIGQGFEPKRTVYLAFGHDEELGGFSGAAQMAGTTGGADRSRRKGLDRREPYG